VEGHRRAAFPAYGKVAEQVVYLPIPPAAVSLFAAVAFKHLLNSIEKLRRHHCGVIISDGFSNGCPLPCFFIEAMRLRNPIFLDRVSGFDWTVIPV
jgi:hypothetical protein